MPATAKGSIRRRHTTVALTPEEELNVRLTGEPAATLAALEAEDEANGSKLARLSVGAALHAASYGDMERARYQMEMAQLRRRAWAER